MPFTITSPAKADTNSGFLIKKKKNVKNVNFINEKEIAYEKIRLRRIKGNQNFVDGRSLLPEGFLQARKIL